MAPPPCRCPGTPPGAVRTRHPACPADPSAPLPADGAERVAMLVLRFVAAAAETGDAACFDAAFDRAEAAHGPRHGPLLVARAAALVRALRRDGAEPRFLPPPCRLLSGDEARILAALRSRASGRVEPAAAALSGAVRAALGELALPMRSAGSEMQVPRGLARAAECLTV